MHTRSVQNVMLWTAYFMRNNRLYLMTARVLGALLCSMLPAVPCYSMEKPYSGPFFENEQLLMVIIPRAPLMDSDGLVTQVWQPRGLPSTFLVGPAGKVHYQALGGRDWDQPAYVEFLRRLK